MFWIGMVVGFIVCIVIARIIASKLGNMSWDEWCDCAMLICDAGQNRESTITVMANDEFVGAYTLEEK